MLLTRFPGQRQEKVTRRSLPTLQLLFAFQVSRLLLPPPPKKVSHCFLAIISAVRAQPQPLQHPHRVLEERFSVKTAPLKEKVLF